jgi:hypothetical protein
VLCLPALGAGVAGAVIDVAVLDAKHRDVAFAVERDVAGAGGGLGILRIGPDAVEHPVQVGRQVAFDFAIEQIDLGSARIRRYR